MTVSPLATVTLPAFRLAAVHHIGPYAEVGTAFHRLNELVGEPPAGTQLIALYYDDPTKVAASELRASAGITVTTGTVIAEGLAEVTVPAGSYAQVIYTGPYAGLGDAWQTFEGPLLKEAGFTRGEGPGVEIYKNTPLTTAPSELVTELYLPVKTA